MYSVLKNCKVWWNIKEWKMIKLETNEPNLSMRQTWFCEKDSLVSSLPMKRKKIEGLGKGNGTLKLSVFFQNNSRTPIQYSL